MWKALEEQFDFGLNTYSLICEWASPLYFHSALPRAQVTSSENYLLLTLTMNNEHAQCIHPCRGFLARGREWPHGLI